MSVDLKGNTNFVVLKNLQDELIVPRTNLAAVDMAVANGLSVAGSTLSINMATTEDIELGTTGSVVTPDALKPILDSKQLTLEAGTGVELVAGETASTISVPLADVETLIDGTTATKVVDVAALRGALTTGQAVDVTSAPDGVTGDYLGSFTVTGSSLGFAAFPKYAKNLNYLFIATIVPTTAGTVTPSANCKWLDTGDRTAKSVAAGVSVKLAVTFTSNANTCPASFALSGTGSVTVSYCRQYEVTACTAESIAYIASLSNPDAFADYYLVKADMVQPWTYIIDMGTSPAVTVAAGLSYKLNATTGTHTLTVDTCPEGYDGRDAIIRIRLGGNGIVQAVAPLQLGGALVPYAINNCVVRFRDGEAVLLVEDTLAGYVVTVTSGTDSGSLAYGLASTGIPYIAFSTSTDGQVVDMGNAVTANEEVTVVGNGYTNTTITGNITCTNKTIVANLGLQDVIVAGGTLTLGDAYIPSGSTVAVSGGGLAVERVSGNGGVIDLGGTNIWMPVNGSAYVNHVIISGGSTAEGGAFSFYQGAAMFNSCTFAQNNADSGGAIKNTFANITMTNNIVSGNNASQGGGIYARGGTMTFSNSVVSGNVASSYGKDIYATSNAVINLDGSTIGSAMLLSASVVNLTGSNVVGEITKRSDALYGTVTLTSGATLDLTGNTNATPIAPGGGITFEAGGATVKVGDSTASSSYMMDNVALPAGAKLTNTAVVDLGGGSAYCYGSASGATIASGNLYVSSGGTADNTTVNVGGSMYVSSGGTASLTYVNSEGGMYVSNGGTADNTTVYDGYLEVYSGGTANSTTVNYDGTMNISAGGVADYATVDGGTVNVYSGGTADKTTLNNFGCLYVSNGGTADNTTVNTGGSMYVSIGGTATNTTVNNFGYLYVSNGGTADNTTINWGHLYVSSGGTADNTTVNSGGYLWLQSGGMANSTTISPKGYLFVSSGATVNETTVNSGGSMRVYSGGTALLVTSKTGAIVTVVEGGYITYKE